MPMSLGALWRLLLACLVVGLAAAFAGLTTGRAMQRRADALAARALAMPIPHDYDTTPEAFAACAARGGQVQSVMRDGAMHYDVCVELMTPIPTGATDSLR